MSAASRRFAAIRTEVPGPRSRELLALCEEHTSPAVAHLCPIAVARAQGALITDVDGNTFIDFAGGIGALNVGHCHPQVVSAVREQAERYLHQCFQVVLYEPYIALARRLNQLTPGSFRKKTILLNSGAEAVENAVKIARRATGRRAIVALDRAFHGRTFMALGLTGQVRPYKDGFGPFPGEVYHIAHSLSALDDLFRSTVAPTEVAAVIFEPVLGEGGFIPLPAELLRGLAEVCARHGILLIADEVQSGFARTGRMFAVEHAGIAPDLMVLAKSLAGGETLSAVVGRADLMDALPPGGLGGTYAGNPLACRAALAAIDVIEREDLAGRAQHIGALVGERFRALKARDPLVGDVRGVGAMMAIELLKEGQGGAPATEETAAIIKACYREGLIILKAGAGANVIRTLMPLVITDEQLGEGLDILEEAVRRRGS